MIYAQIKDEVVKNCIVLDDPNLESLFVQGFDLLIRVDQLDPQPGRDWSYSNGVFSPPPPEFEG